MRQLKFWTANTRAGKNENTSSNKSLLLLFSPDQAKVVPPVNNSVNSKASLVTNGNCKLEKERKRGGISLQRGVQSSVRDGHNEPHWPPPSSLGEMATNWPLMNLHIWPMDIAVPGLDWTGLVIDDAAAAERRKWKVNERTQTEHWRHCACPKQAITEEKVERAGRTCPQQK